MNSLQGINKVEDPTSLALYENGKPVIAISTPQTSLYGSEGEKIKTISQILEDTVFIERGHPFRFIEFIPQMDGTTICHNREYLKKIYDIDPFSPRGCRNQVLQWARQTEKSSTAACKAIALGASIPGLKGLFVQPRFDQVSVFSQQRFKKIAEESPKIKREMLSTGNIWQVGMKGFNDGAIFNFRSCYLSADPVRGISTDYLSIDEIQDLISDQIPVIEECQSHASPAVKFRVYTGTPKTRMNSLNMRHENSCQWEWLVKCEHCSNWNYQDERMIGLKFYICTHCGKEIFPKKIKNPKNPRDFGGEWHAQKKSLIDVCWGYRIPQIMVPFQTFESVVEKRNNSAMSHSMFLNEVLALPSDEGELVLTEMDVFAACEESRKVFETPATVKKLLGGAPLFMGIDHGTGLRSSDVGVTRKKHHPTSFTVTVIGGFGVDEKFRIVHMEKYLGEKTNLVKQPMYFDKTARDWKATFVGSDWGFGHINNQRLIDDYAWDDRQVGRPNPIMLEMESVEQKKLVVFNGEAGRSGRYMIDRTQCMSMLIDAIKTRRVLFPCREIMQNLPMKDIPFLHDFVSIYLEFDERRNKMKYDHTMPDDTFQAVMLCYLAAKQYYGEFAATALPDVRALADEDY